ncbi:MAG: hypothetical protein H0V68_01760 [Actinobacteria bacterium]|nr:hypothetical protein [Actinomycetota bacterium]
MRHAQRPIEPAGERGRGGGNGCCCGEDEREQDEKWAGTQPRIGLAAHAESCATADNGATLVDLLPDLLTEIRSLLDQSANGERPPRAVVEDVLTTGYAHALALEGERLRVERRLREVLRSGGSGGPLWADELGQLTKRIEDADRELARLRGLLATLRAQALSREPSGP